jgi:hypothetical protein
MTPEAAQELVRHTYRSFVDAGDAFKALADRGERSAAVDAVLHVHETSLRLAEAEKVQRSVHAENRVPKSQSGAEK